MLTFCKGENACLASLKASKLHFKTFNAFPCGHITHKSAALMLLKKVFMRLTNVMGTAFESHCQTKQEKSFEKPLLPQQHTSMKSK